MELHEALTQISEIRRQLARTEVFRGYRAVPVAFSGLLAFAAALFQIFWIPEPERDVACYMTLWVGAAAISVLGVGVEMAVRYRRSGSSLKREITVLAVEQFVPCVVAGGLLMLVVSLFAHGSLWMLPGLWEILFSLGLFSSYRLLPRAIFWVGMFYLLSGICCLALAQGEHAFSPWAMGIPFGVGQLLAAAVLYWTLERNHGEE
jgi:hypothetical protein